MRGYEWTDPPKWCGRERGVAGEGPDLLELLLIVRPLSGGQSKEEELWGVLDEPES